MFVYVCVIVCVGMGMGVCAGGINKHGLQRKVSGP
jgi:hypothetical protein